MLDGRYFLSFYRLPNFFAPRVHKLDFCANELTLFFISNFGKASFPPHSSYKQLLF
jgi:hypothetical protein